MDRSGHEPPERATDEAGGPGAFSSAKTAPLSRAALLGADGELATLKRARSPVPWVIGVTVALGLLAIVVVILLRR